MHAQRFAAVAVLLATGLLIDVASGSMFPRMKETFGEAFHRYKTVAIGEFVDAGETDQRSWVTATFRVTDVLQGAAEHVGQLVTVRIQSGPTSGDVAVLVTDREARQATSAQPAFAAFSRIGISPAAVRYVASLPRERDASAESLPFYIRFLEHDDETIARDAFGHCSTADCSTLRTIADQLPRESLRRWVMSDEIDVRRRGFYGLMLGACGEEKDQALLHSKIVEESGQFYPGGDGIIAGYFLLAGEPGLAFVEKRNLRDDAVSFHETYFAMVALRTLWNVAVDSKEHEDSSETKITKDRLRQSMRILLGRPNLADLAIGELTHWSDWSQMDEIYALYGAEGYDVPTIRRAIIRYFLMATHVETDRPSAKQLAKAEKYLAELKVKDLKAVKAAERFLFVN